MKRTFALMVFSYELFFPQIMDLDVSIDIP